MKGKECRNILKVFWNDIKVYFTYIKKNYYKIVKQR